MEKIAKALTCAWLAVAAAFALTPARADVYTWSDAAGNVHVSNLAPPAGAHVTAVAHESAAAIARAEAARKAAQDAEVRALADRVADLERAAEQSSRAVPPPSYVASAPPMAPPPPQYTVTMMPAAAPDDAAPAYGGCAWAGCPLPIGAALYGAPVVVVTAVPNRRGRNVHRPHALAQAAAAHPMAATPVPVRAVRRR